MIKFKLFVVFAFLLQIGTANAVSFDCSKAKSYSEKLICSNSELSELDDKLNSLYQKVKLESADKKAFRKIVSDLWNEREKCKTESCVRQWYSNAFREYSSLNEINENIINESKNYAEWYIDGALIILPP
ncbi:lysozyme inhibitor LprI family protein, partial [Escherichia coli]